jgi:hypothetical protein
MVTYGMHNFSLFVVSLASFETAFHGEGVLSVGDVHFGGLGSYTVMMISVG